MYVRYGTVGLGAVVYGPYTSIPHYGAGFTFHRESPSTVERRVQLERDVAR